MKLSAWILGLAFLAISSVGSQAAYVMEYSTGLTVANPASASAIPYATVTIESGNGVDAGNIRITVDLENDFDGASIEQIGFNTTLAPFGGTITGVGGAAAWSTSGGGNLSTFGGFDVVFEGTSVSDMVQFVISGVAADTFTTYASKGSSGGQPNANSLFVVKISSQEPGGAFIGGGAVVPIPAALPLLLSGLAVFGWLARKRRSAAAA